MIRKQVALMTAALIVVAGAASAQEAASSGSAAAKGAAAATAGPATVNANASAEASARAQADLEALRKEIDERASKVSTKARADAEAKLDATAKAVDSQAQAAADGSQQVAARLAAEFQTTSQAMLDERQALDAGWGELMIAHTLAANAKDAVTVEALFDMKRDGQGWGTLAAGLGMKLGSVVSSVETEGRVANGLAKADGKVALIQGPGARAGANAGLGLGIGHERGVGATAGVGAGVKIGH